MNKFKYLKYFGYSVLVIPTVILIFIVYGVISYALKPSQQPVVTKQIKPKDTIIVVTPPIQITNPVIEKTTTNTTTIINNETKPVVEVPKKEPVKPQIEIKPQVIDTTKVKDSL